MKKKSLSELKHTTDILDDLIFFETNNPHGPIFGAAYAIGAQAAFRVIMNIMANITDDDKKSELMQKIINDTELILRSARAVVLGTDDDKEAPEKKEPAVRTVLSQSQTVH